MAVHGRGTRFAARASRHAIGANRVVRVPGGIWPEEEAPRGRRRLLAVGAPTGAQ